jgi:hypothetical protein
MINIKIDKTYSLPEYWSEITCKTAGELFAIPIPKALKDNYDYLTKVTKTEPIITDIDLKKHIPEYFGKVISLLGNVPENIIAKTNRQDRYAIYNEYLEKFVIGVHYEPFDYKVQNLKSFEVDGETLYFPEPKEKLGRIIPMDITTWEFTESVDLEIFCGQFAEGKYYVAPNIASILCRPKGEEYDEETCLERAKKMQDLPMDVVWEVFFCLLELLNLHEKHALKYLIQTLTQEQNRSLKKQAYKAGMDKLSTWAKRWQGLRKSKRVMYGIS